MLQQTENQFYTKWTWKGRGNESVSSRVCVQSDIRNRLSCLCVAERTDGIKKEMVQKEGEGEYGRSDCTCQQIFLLLLSHFLLHADRQIFDKHLIRASCFLFNFFQIFISLSRVLFLLSSYFLPSSLRQRWAHARLTETKAWNMHIITDTHTDDTISRLPWQPNNEPLLTSVSITLSISRLEKHGWPCYERSIFFLFCLHLHFSTQSFLLTPWIIN